LQQVGQSPQHSVPQQSASQQALQQVGQLSQHAVPQQPAAAGRATEAPPGTANELLASMNTIESRVFMEMPFWITRARRRRTVDFKMR
jgi:hypothetical protein